MKAREGATLGCWKAEVQRFEVDSKEEPRPWMLPSKLPSRLRVNGAAGCDFQKDPTLYFLFC